MKYKLYFDVIWCDRAISSFMKACDLCDGVGTSQRISFVTTTEPTDEYIEKMTKVLESTKDEKKLGAYLMNVEYIGTEVIEDEK